MLICTFKNVTRFHSPEAIVKGNTSKVSHSMLKNFHYYANDKKKSQYNMMLAMHHYHAPVSSYEKLMLHYHGSELVIVCIVCCHFVQGVQTTFDPKCSVFGVLGRLASFGVFVALRSITFSY